MAKRAQEQKQGTRNPWVPSGIGATGAENITPKPPSTSADADEWLAIPRSPTLGTRGNGSVRANGNGHVPEVEAEPAETPRPAKRRKLPKRATARERWLITRLHRAKQRAEDQREEIDRLKGEIKELRAAPPKATPKSTPKSEPASTPKATRKRAAHGKATTTSQRNRAEKVDLQKASFEELRGLGLSVTQSARLIAYREAGPGFDSVDELDAIPGFANATLGKLRERARVGTR